MNRTVAEAVSSSMSLSAAWSPTPAQRLVGLASRLGSAGRLHRLGSAPAWSFGLFLEYQEKGLRIAWQYKKYMGEHQPNFDSNKGIGDDEYAVSICMLECTTIGKCIL